jgi:predicted ATP-dependent endonuclease of OLD family
LTIRGFSGESLAPDLLSSGERQLLTLLCHLLPARKTAAIFMIDEPELSLNIKWQRKLLDSLLGFTKGASIQLIMATHSVEMITPHRAEIVRFIPVGESVSSAKPQLIETV